MKDKPESGSKCHSEDKDHNLIKALDKPADFRKQNSLKTISKRKMASEKVLVQHVRGRPQKGPGLHRAGYGDHIYRINYFPPKQNKIQTIKLLCI